MTQYFYKARLRHKAYADAFLVVVADNKTDADKAIHTQLEIVNRSMEDFSTPYTLISIQPICDTSEALWFDDGDVEIA